LGVSPTIAQVLYNRGVSTLEEARAFLDPKLNGITEPDDMPDLVRAAKRIIQAVASKEPITIYGDYDVDGIAGTAILWHVIVRTGGKVSYYVPHRIEEGYGLNQKAIEKLSQNGTKLLITVDCGIRDHSAVAYAKSLGLSVIVTDHHEPEDHYPSDADAVLHPARCKEIGKELQVNPCGAAVAFKLAWAVAREYSGGKKTDDMFRNLLVDLTSLVALATIADIVPLIGENRTLVKFGLDRISKTKLTGLQALLKDAGLQGSKVDSYHCGFVLGPRLNAAGRMGHAHEALNLLITSDAKEADDLAKYLNKQNRARQKLEERITKEAIETADKQGQLDDQVPILVIAERGWHAGVIGIVASKLVDRFNKPVILIAMPDKGKNIRAQGSCRSIPGYDINQGLESCKDLLVGYGGHAMAAGLRIMEDNIFPFMKRIQQHASQYLKSDVELPDIAIDAEVSPEEIDGAFVHELHRLGPFGHGNPRPIFVTGQTELLGEPKIVGAGGKHLSFSVRWGEKVFRAIAYNQSESADFIRNHRTVHLAFEPVIDDYSGPGVVQLRVKAIRAADKCPGK
jgi:single-stranded-DNA-specific exonuclease